MVQLILNPRDLETKPIDRAGISASLINILFGTLVAAIILVVVELTSHVIEFLLIDLFSLYPASDASRLLSTFVMYPLSLIILTLGLTLLSQIAYFIFAKFLGGNGSFIKQLYIFSLVAPALTVGLNILIWLVIFTPLSSTVGLIALIWSLIFLVYTLYSMYYVFKVSQNLSLMKFIVLQLASYSVFFLIRQILGY